jgi:hypothetical protein
MYNALSVDSMRDTNRILVIAMYLERMGWRQRVVELDTVVHATHSCLGQLHHT